LVIDKKFNNKRLNNKMLKRIKLNMLDVNFFTELSRNLLDLNIKKIDILVNNAGITFSNNFLTYKHNDWNKTIELNLSLPFKLSQYVSTHYMKFSGSIINITSLACMFGFPNNPAYVSSKAGLRGLTTSLAYDLASKKIRVNAIAPGYIKTNMTKVSWSKLNLRKKRNSRILLNRWGKPKDVANLALFLGSDLAGYITGQNIFVDGGWSVKGI
jgi:NAD(P)-dependent dehydrogenase (short-subunit alcohol dehydrogenase family)